MLKLAEDLSLPIDTENDAGLQRHLDLAWAAGLFEGGGTVTIAVRNSDQTYRLVIIVGNTDPEVIGFFDERWPGWVQPFYGERLSRKAGSSWTRAGPRAEEFIREIFPYIRCSRVRAKMSLALRFRAAQSRRKTEWSQGTYKPKQKTLYDAMKLLNKRGAA